MTHTVNSYSLDVDEMFATVYRCRHERARMDRLKVQPNPVAGELVVHRRGFSRRIAKLLAKAGETYLIPVLDKVRLLTINDRGVLMSGYEMDPPRGLKGIRRSLPADLVVSTCPQETR